MKGRWCSGRVGCRSRGGSSPGRADNLVDEQNLPQAEVPSGSITVAGLEPLGLRLPEVPFPPVLEDLVGLDGIGSYETQLKQFETTYDARQP